MGVDKVQPKNEDDKKDRSTNYHHTIDAIVISLLNQSSKKALNDFFKQNEKGLKIEVILENIRLVLAQNGITHFIIQPESNKYNSISTSCCNHL